MLVAERPFEPPLARRYGLSSRTALAVLLALMAVNCVDRQVVVALFPALKSQWALSDAELGGLSSIVAVGIGLGCIPVSLAADRFDRMRAIVAMALLWSSATIACGLASDYATLLVARALVGLGEAGFATTGAALLSELFPERRRSTVLGAFIAAGIVGAFLGVVLGGYVAHAWGWRAAFVVAGAPGWMIALPLLVVAARSGREPSPSRDRPRIRLRSVMRRVLEPRTTRVTCLAAGLHFVTVAMVYAWLPTYFVRTEGLAIDAAAWRTGLLVLLSAVCSIGWSALADARATRDPASRMHVAAATSFVTAAMLVPAFGLLAPGLLASGLLVLGVAAMYGTVGATSAVLADVVPASMRATSISMLATAQNLVGLAIGPWLAGWLSDRFGLAVALGTVPIASMLAAVAFLAGARHYREERPHALAPMASATEIEGAEVRPSRG